MEEETPPLQGCKVGSIIYNSSRCTPMRVIRETERTWWVEAIEGYRLHYTQNPGNGIAKTHLRYFVDPKRCIAFHREIARKDFEEAELKHKQMLAVTPPVIDGVTDEWGRLLNYRAITQDFISRLRGKEQMECCATQDAIDKLAEEYGRGREWLFEMLATTTDTQLHDMIICAWANSPLKIATDRSRDEWLELFN